MELLLLQFIQQGKVPQFYFILQRTSLYYKRAGSAGKVPRGRSRSTILYYSLLICTTKGQVPRGRFRSIVLYYNVLVCTCQSGTTLARERPVHSRVRLSRTGASPAQPLARVAPLSRGSARCTPECASLAREPPLRSPLP